MCIFNKENGAHPMSCTPQNNLKMFFDMSKITTSNLVLQRNGEKNSHVIYYQRNKKIKRILG